jgi:hypothetical protein
MEVSGHHTLAAEPLTNVLSTDWIGGCEGPRTSVAIIEKRNNSVAPVGIRTPDRPTRSIVFIPNVLKLVAKIQA